ncbi:response regulator receiver domain-containing protein [Mucilaginibacter frigoritolerans]|jgi:DNA-binding response OmpR family regulator|uniref:Response regulator receiver domain-containing protein n=1 Tax=Mucilaginibacter frigoritolerans TaxID=652788 RepID=A0A562TPR0_9SPHI|nr:response regulator [Mucilaginibacter frigoritolerans]TWI95525.1 response regulator receiver domain-containing protein [Mucilaginibacter frigoritolerans]
MKKILVLDDDKDHLRIVSFILTDFGYEVRTLLHGETIFEEIADFKPDLILMDVMLAGMDGRVICRSIKENPLLNYLPVILISITHDLAESMHLQGAPNDYISKPLDIDRLLSSVKKQLEV